MIAVADSSPPHYLILIGHDFLLPALFGQVLIPPAVLAELSHPRAPAAVRAWSAFPPPWLALQRPSSIDPGIGLGIGEREAIALAVETAADFLLADDRAARVAAKARGLTTVGTLGVLEMAANRGLVMDLAAAFALLKQTNFRATEAVYQTILARAVKP